VQVLDGDHHRPVLGQPFADLLGSVLSRPAQAVPAAELGLSYRDSRFKRPVREAEGASLRTVVKMTVYLAQASDYDVFKRVRGELFAPPYPASTAVVGGGFLFEGMLVEMDAVARVGEARM